MYIYQGIYTFTKEQNKFAISQVSNITILTFMTNLAQFM